MPPIEILPLEQIPVAAIADPAWNSRVSAEDPENFAKLVASVKSDGIRSPVMVQRLNVVGAGPAYRLVFGSRRLKASREAGLTTIPALVQPIAADGAGEQARIDLMVENARENLARKDLTPYEQARTFSELRKAGMKLGDVSRRVGVTEGHVSNLATIYVQADPKVLTEWAHGNPAATTGFLRDLVAKEKDGPTQVLLFKEREKQLAASTEETADEGEEEEDDAEEGPTKDKPADKFHVDKGRYRLLLKRLGASKSPAIAVAAVKYLVGTITKIPGVIQDED